jgi:hypothetical protein
MSRELFQTPPPLQTDLLLTYEEDRALEPLYRLLNPADRFAGLPRYVYSCANGAPAPERISSRPREILAWRNAPIPSC